MELAKIVLHIQEDPLMEEVVNQISVEYLRKFWEMEPVNNAPNMKDHKETVSTVVLILAMLENIY